MQFGVHCIIIWQERETFLNGYIEMKNGLKWKTYMCIVNLYTLNGNLVRSNLQKKNLSGVHNLDPIIRLNYGELL